MLLNLSNHPFSEWQKSQEMAAIDQYQVVQDMPFPHIKPEASEKEILKLAMDYHKQILSLNPAAVHIQGEHTFTYTLVSLLQQKGIRCLASTTARNVITNDQGDVMRSFRFVQFRKYPIINTL
ncbi:MAG TPA: hypothetical protein VKA34_12910 [Balneolales bacterium]|nr:hypothetical protein [Balneolales bacterium]